MKRHYLIICLFAMCSIVMAGYVVNWDTAKPAPISLPVAYDDALVALGSQTNDFHCLNAEVSGFWSYGDAAWVFVFYSTNAPPKTKRVVVHFDGHSDIDPLIVR